MATVNCKYDSERNIIIVSFLEAIYDENQNTAQAQEAIDLLFGLISQRSIATPVTVAVDLRPMKDKAFISEAAKKLYMQFVGDERIRKVAVIGSSDAQTSIANFILGFNSDLSEKLSWFSSDVEAFYWLRK